MSRALPSSRGLGQFQPGWGSFSWSAGLDDISAIIQVFGVGFLLKKRMSLELFGLRLVINDFDIC